MFLFVGIIFVIFFIVYKLIIALGNSCFQNSNKSCNNKYINNYYIDNRKIIVSKDEINTINK